MWRTRVIGLEFHKAGDLLDHPLQWKIHPDYQQAVVRGILEEIGIADVLLAYRDEHGRLVKVDGHARSGLDPEQVWPVIVLDLSDQEAALLLASIDRTAAMSASDGEKLADLLAAIPEPGDAAVSALLDELRHESDQTALAEFEGKSSGRGADRESMIKAVIYTHDLGSFERAIMATGERNRAAAILRICEFYLEQHGTERQFDREIENLLAAPAAA